MRRRLSAGPFRFGDVGETLEPVRGIVRCYRFVGSPGRIEGMDENKFTPLYTPPRSYTWSDGKDGLSIRSKQLDLGRLLKASHLSRRSCKMSTMYLGCSYRSMYYMSAEGVLIILEMRGGRLPCSE